MGFRVLRFKLVGFSKLEGQWTLKGAQGFLCGLGFRDAIITYFLGPSDSNA